jgi:hypothetical protein
MQAASPTRRRRSFQHAEKTKVQVRSQKTPLKSKQRGLRVTVTRRVVSRYVGAPHLWGRLLDLFDLQDGQRANVFGQRNKAHRVHVLRRTTPARIDTPRKKLANLGGYLRVRLFLRNDRVFVTDQWVRVVTRRVDQTQTLVGRRPRIERRRTGADRVGRRE